MFCSQLIDYVNKERSLYNFLKNFHKECLPTYLLLIKTNRNVYLGIRNISLIKADIHNPKSIVQNLYPFILSGSRLLWFFFFEFLKLFVQLFHFYLTERLSLPLSYSECSSSFWLLFLIFCFGAWKLVINSLELSLMEINDWQWGAAMIYGCPLLLPPVGYLVCCFPWALLSILIFPFPPSSTVYFL